MPDKECIIELITYAIEARNNAYSPYSHFAVGAAVMAGEKVFTGCNIENSSYGATICAERVAVCAAVKEGFRDISMIAIVGGREGEEPDEITYPCGICRQFLSEFNPDMYVIAAKDIHDYDMRKLSDFLPEYFRLKE